MSLEEPRVTRATETGSTAWVGGQTAGEWRRERVGEKERQTAGERETGSKRAEGRKREETEVDIRREKERDREKSGS